MVHSSSLLLLGISSSECTGSCAGGCIGVGPDVNADVCTGGSTFILNCTCLPGFEYVL